MNRKDLSRVLCLSILGLMLLATFALIAGCSDDDDGGGTGPSGSSAWRIVQPDLEGNHFRGLWFVDAQEGWLVGTDGALLHTADGGASWTEQSSGTNNSLWDVTFMDADTGWVVGNGGELLRTGNGGVTWRNDLLSATTKDMHAVEFVTPRKGFAVGASGAILFSVDGGRRWNVDSTGLLLDLFDLSIFQTSAIAAGDDGQIVKFTGYDQEEVRMTTDTTDADSFYNADTVFQYDSSIVSIDTTIVAPDTTIDTTFAVDTLAFPPGTVIDSINYFYDTLFITVDTIWSDYEAVATPVDHRLRSVYLIDENNGWAVGDSGTVLVTADGGTSWTQESSGTDKDLLKVRFSSATDGWIVGRDGLVMSTSDGGSTWVMRDPDVNYDLYDIGVANGSIWAVGDLAVLESEDNGGTWSLMPTNTVPLPTLSDIGFSGSNVGVIVGDGSTIIRTDDGGDSWRMIRRGSRFNPTEWIGVLQVVDSSFMVAAGGAGIPPYQSLFMRTEDSGLTWMPLADPEINRMRDVYFTDTAVGWALAGLSLYRTDNSGELWTEQSLPTAVNLNAITFADSSHGFIVGDGGTILRTLDGGATWQDMTTDTLTGTLVDVDFPAVDSGWIVGGGGLIWSTSDTGATWVAQNSGTTEGLRRLRFLDDLTGYAVGGRGTILYTDNGGQTWIRQPSPVLYSLVGLYFLDADIGWIVGEDGTILKTTTGGK